MKTLKITGAFLTLIVGAQLLTACSGYIVATGPPSPPVEVIISAPAPHYVWVPGYYSYNRSTYIWVDGSYQVPPRGRTTYVQGRWQQGPKGYKRSRGHWQ